MSNPRRKQKLKGELETRTGLTDPTLEGHASTRGWKGQGRNKDALLMCTLK